MPRAYTTIRSKVSATSWRVRSLHGFGLLVANDHVLLILADGAHLAVQLGHVAHLLEGAVHEVLAHGIDAEHAEHARAPQKAQQDQHHGDGPNMRNRMVNCRMSEKRFMIRSSSMECLGLARVCAN